MVHVRLVKEIKTNIAGMNVVVWFARTTLRTNNQEFCLPKKFPLSCKLVTVINYIILGLV